MSDDTAAKETARDRLFDALLTEAVAAESAPTPMHRTRHLAWAAVALLAALVTIGVAVLRANGDDEAQEPKALDVLFPRIEREFHRDRLHLQLRTPQQVHALPNGPLPPIAALPGGATGDGPVPVDVVDALGSRAGVRSLTVAGDSSLPVASWRRIAAIPDLEALNICCDVDAACLRELRLAPQLRALGLGKRESRIDADLVAALLELPHLDSLQLVWQQIAPAQLAAFAGLPGLHSLYMESCSTEPGWLDALAGLRTVRWLGLAVGRWQNAVLTAEDLHCIGRMPRLESLSLHKVEIADADYAALPEALRVIALPEPVPASVVRELLARPRLRGVSFARLEPAVETVLCELLPTTKLERFGHGGRVSEALWSALGRLPRLRHLSFSASNDIADDLRRVVDLKHLEHLAIHASMPPPETLRRLRDLPALHRVVISGVGDGSEYTADLAALQQALGPRVDLIVR